MEVTKTCKVLLCCTGSVASIKVPQIVKELSNNKFDVKVVATERALHFCKVCDIPTTVHVDEEEWKTWNQRGDPVLHIELRRWADIMLIAPLDANTMAKISNGLCDNLLTCVVRAWDMKRPLLYAPAMNTYMWDHPLTAEQTRKLQHWGYKEIPVVEKTLMCGDKGAGAMAEVSTIVDYAIEARQKLILDGASFSEN